MANATYINKNITEIEVRRKAHKFTIIDKQMDLLIISSNMSGLTKDTLRLIIHKTLSYGNTTAVYNGYEFMEILGVNSETGKKRGTRTTVSKCLKRLEDWKIITLTRGRYDSKFQGSVTLNIKVEEWLCNYNKDYVFSGKWMKSTIRQDDEERNSRDDAEHGTLKSDTKTPLGVASQVVNPEDPIKVKEEQTRTEPHANEAPLDSSQIIDIAEMSKVEINALLEEL